jgi:hypothetical protein
MVAARSVDERRVLTWEAGYVKVTREPGIVSVNGAESVALASLERG